MRSRPPAHDPGPRRHRCPVKLNLQRTRNPNQPPPPGKVYGAVLGQNAHHHAINLPLSCLGDVVAHHFDFPLGVNKIPTSRPVRQTAREPTVKFPRPTDYAPCSTSAHPGKLKSLRRIQPNRLRFIARIAQRQNAFSGDNEAHPYTANQRGSPQPNAYLSGSPHSPATISHFRPAHPSSPASGAMA